MAAPVQKTVTTSAVLLVAANEARTKLHIRNETGQGVWIGDAATVTILTGFWLPEGELWEEERTLQNDPYFYWGAYYAIAGSGSVVVHVWEKERIRSGGI